MNLTNRFRSNTPSQTITCRVGVTGQDHLNRTEDDEPMPFISIELGNENVHAKLNNPIDYRFRRGEVVRLRVTDIEKVMRGHWQGEIEKLLERYDEVYNE